MINTKDLSNVTLSFIMISIFIPMCVSLTNRMCFPSSHVQQYTTEPLGRGECGSGVSCPLCTTKHTGMGQHNMFRCACERLMCASINTHSVSLPNKNELVSILTVNHTQLSELIQVAQGVDMVDSVVTQMCALALFKR